MTIKTKVLKIAKTAAMKRTHIPPMIAKKRNRSIDMKEGISKRNCYQKRSKGLVKGLKSCEDIERMTGAKSIMVVYAPWDKCVPQIHISKNFIIPKCKKKQLADAIANQLINNQIVPSGSPPINLLQLPTLLLVVV